MKIKTEKSDWGFVVAVFLIVMVFILVHYSEIQEPKHYPCPIIHCGNDWVDVDKIKEIETTCEITDGRTLCTSIAILK